MCVCVCVFWSPGLEELVLSEISSPSRTQQTGDSSSVSSFSYREMMKEGGATQSANKVPHCTHNLHYTTLHYTTLQSVDHNNPAAHNALSQKVIHTTQSPVTRHTSRSIEIARPRVAIDDHVMYATSRCRDNRIPDSRQTAFAHEQRNQWYELDIRRCRHRQAVVDSRHRPLLLTSESSLVELGDLTCCSMRTGKTINSPWVVELL